MVEEFLISVIIPTYNSEKSIEATIESVVKQTIFDYIEIIIVDDGSTDNTVDVALAYKNLYSNIVVVRNKHKGVSYSRNTGISMSRAKYIAFVDSDDVVNENIYEVLLNNLRQYNADLSLCGFFSERTNSNNIFPYTGLCSENMKKYIMLYMLGAPTDDLLSKNIWGSVCRGLYKRSIIKQFDIKFNEQIEFAEDLLFTYKYLTCCDKLYLSNDILYYYNCTPGSLMMSHQIEYKNNMIQKRLMVIEELSVLSDAYGLSNFYKYLNVTIRSYTLECIGNEFHNVNISRKKIVDRIYDMLSINEIQSAFDDFKGCKNFKKNIIYRLLKMKKINIIYVYYFFRVFRKNKEVRRENKCNE